MGLECGVDDAGDDEERAPSKTFAPFLRPRRALGATRRTSAS